MEFHFRFFHFKAQKFVEYEFSSCYNDFTKIEDFRRLMNLFLQEKLTHRPNSG